MKSTNLKFRKKDYFRSLTAMLALVTTLQGCSLEKQNFTQNDAETTTTIEKSTEMIPEQYNEDISDCDDISFSETEIDIEVEENETEEVQPTLGMDKVEDTKIVLDKNLIIPDLSQSLYTGVSIVDALLYEGYPADPNYRAQLAQYFEIDNYQGLASQNILLLHYLRTWNIVDHTVSTNSTQESKTDNNTDNSIDNSINDNLSGTVSDDVNDDNMNDNVNNDIDDSNTNGSTSDSIKDDNESDHNHTYTWKYEDATYEKGECECGDITLRKHDYTWEFGKDTDKGLCDGCGDEQTRVHIHKGTPEVVSVQANGDRTHELTTSYDCELCGETVEEIQTESCDYSQSSVTYEEIRGGGFAVSNKHKEIQSCSICNDVAEEEKECVATGKKQYIRYLSQIYEYFICKLCGNRCEQYPHYTHELGDWEVVDDTQHRRECGCTEVRKIGNHTFTYDINANEWNMICSVCGYVKTCAKHEHATDNMDLWDLMMSPHYSQLISKSQIKNPNPSPYDYCSRYDFNCPTCGFYSTYYDHEFVDGACTRVGHCGGIADPNYTATSTSLNEEINVPVQEEVSIELLPSEEDIEAYLEAIMAVEMEECTEKIKTIHM